MRALPSVSRVPAVTRALPSDAVETRIAATPPAHGIDLPVFRRALLRWYDKHHRDLPWRRTCDPYRIWLSEIMLQQTRVAAVLDHYRIFLDRFPNVRSLAAASQDAVLAAWSGLGYYRRARMLHRCAREIVEEQRGHFPRSSEALQTLPGIGRYTSAAIASIAFAEPIAVVDGNVDRVLARVVGRNLSSKETWQHAQSLLSSSRPGDFNQAMMELGATVCMPREPKCPSCPIRKWCVSMEGRAPSRGRTGVTPVPPSLLSRQTKKELWCSLSRRDGHIRLVQRPKRTSLMAGMWELPQSSDAPRPSPTSSHWRTFRHSITATDYTVHVLRDGAPSARGKWIAIEKIPEIPITGLTRKILRADGII